MDGNPDRNQPMHWIEGQNRHLNLDHWLCYKARKQLWSRVIDPPREITEGRAKLASEFAEPVHPVAYVRP